MIDQIARTSAAEIRSATTGDAAAGLADLHARQARHRRRAGFAAATTVVLAAGVGVGAGTLIAHQNDAAPAPSHPVTTTAAPGTHLLRPWCDAPRIDCLDHHTFRYALARPVTWTLPRGFSANSGSGATSREVESYRLAQPTAGVSVLEDVHASSADGTGTPSGVTGPQALAQWIAGRPFLSAGPVRTTTLDGHPAWQVRVLLAPHTPEGPATCTDRYACYAVARQPGGDVVGIFDNMAAELTTLRLPGAGTTLVWSWVFSGDTRDLAGLDQAVRGLSWRAD